MREGSFLILEPMPVPRVPSIVPPLVLPSMEGEEVSLWQFRQRQPVVVVFLGEDRENLWTEWEQHYPRFQQRGVALWIVRSSPPDSGQCLPLLIDEKERQTRRYTRRLPTVWVVDRFGELSACWEGKENLPGHGAVMEEILYLESQCPECGVSHWR